MSARWGGRMEWNELPQPPALIAEYLSRRSSAWELQWFLSNYCRSQRETIPMLIPATGPRLKFSNPDALLWSPEGHTYTHIWERAKSHARWASVFYVTVSGYLRHRTWPQKHTNLLDSTTSTQNREELLTRQRNVFVLGIIRGRVYCPSNYSL